MNQEKPTSQTSNDTDPAFVPGTDEYAARKRAEMEPRLAGRAVEVTPGMITVPESIRQPLQEQAEQEAAPKPAPKPLIEMPEHMVPKGYEASPNPEEVAESIKANYQPGSQAIRQHGVQVGPDRYVMPEDLPAYEASKDKEE